VVIGAIGFGFAAFSVVAGALAGPKRYNRAKLDAYECGIEPSPQAAEGGRFPVKYFLTAMLFIIFDIEIVFSIHGRFHLMHLVCLVWLKWRSLLQLFLLPMHMFGVAVDWNGTNQWVLKKKSRVVLY
jgi:NADH:ubiquinone oxidoreductase subunit 3 (subunit A)